MKKFLLFSILLCLCSSFQTSAQLQKKDFLMGGSFQFSSSHSPNGYHYENFAISPRIGYAIAEHSVISANLGYLYGRSNSAINGRIANSYLTGGISVKQYLDLTHRFGWSTNFFAAGSIGTIKSISPGEPDSELRYSGLQIGFIPGLYIVATHSILILADLGGINYGTTYTKPLDTRGLTESRLNINFLSAFSFGIDFIIHNRRK